MSTDVQKKIAEDVKSHKIIMYVKGHKGMPMCGFSKRVMDIFMDLGVDFETRDVLSDPEIREGVKQFTQWPTIPQIFINGEFVGGCDIVTDLYVSGELKKMVEATK
ncbi:MAG: Grx4 family monothiol glutaredoxin [Deltaproteobacteria bacterium]|jgi:monothiol glutaredoxin